MGLHPPQHATAKPTGIHDTCVGCNPGRRNAHAPCDAPHPTAVREHGRDGCGECSYAVTAHALSWAMPAGAAYGKVRILGSNRRTSRRCNRTRIPPAQGMGQAVTHNSRHTGQPQLIQDSVTHQARSSHSPCVVPTATRPSAVRSHTC
jgi:hypothetical protein